MGPAGSHVTAERPPLWCFSVAPQFDLVKGNIDFSSRPSLMIGVAGLHKCSTGQDSFTGESSD